MPVVTSIAAVLLMAVLITIHEFGHFIVAKACGVRVRVFSVGIGPRLFGFRHGDTDYRVSWIPFGGYVRMYGADPFMDAGGDEGDPRAPGAFMAASPLKRLLIVFAGPAMNLLLPFVVFTALKVAGEPQPRSDVGTVYAGSVAETAGLQAEDRITTVDGAPITTWYDVLEAFAASHGPQVDLVVERDGAPIAVSLPAEGAGADREPLQFGFGNSVADTSVVIDSPRSPAARAGLRTGDTIVAVSGEPVRTWNEVRRLAMAAADAPTGLTLSVKRDDESPVDLVLPHDPAWAPAPEPADDALWSTWGLSSATLSIGTFSEDSAAKAAGLKEGDRLLAIDGHAIRTWRDVIQAVTGTASGQGEELTTRSLTLTFRRAGTVHTVTVTPEVVKDTDELGRYRWRPLVGIGGGGGMIGSPLVPRHYPFGEALTRANKETLTVAGFIVEQIGKMTTGEASPRENLGGPVAIFRQTKAAAEHGLYEWARQLGLFSISLGIVNLLPIPVLDGGQLMMYFAEWVRGRPLPLLMRERAQQAGVIFLVLLMLFVLANDIHRAAFG